MGVTSEAKLVSIDLSQSMWWDVAELITKVFQSPEVLKLANAEA
jgi:hypothetical protein